MSDVTITDAMIDAAVKACGPFGSMWYPAEDVVRRVLESALAAAPRPAEEADGLEKAIAECEAKGWDWLTERIDGNDGPFYRAAVFVGDRTVVKERTESPLAALRAAMAQAKGGQG